MASPAALRRRAAPGSQSVKPPARPLGAPAPSTVGASCTRPVYRSTAETPLGTPVTSVLVLGTDVLVGVVLRLEAAGVLDVPLGRLHALELLAAVVAAGGALLLVRGVVVDAARGEQRLLGVGAEVLAAGSAGDREGGLPGVLRGLVGLPDHHLDAPVVDPGHGGRVAVAAADQREKPAGELVVAVAEVDAADAAGAELPVLGVELDDVAGGDGDVHPAGGRHQHGEAALARLLGEEVDVDRRRHPLDPRRRLEQRRELADVLLGDDVQRVEAERLLVGLERLLRLAELGERLAEPVVGVLLLAVPLEEGAVDRERLGPPALEGERDRLLDVQGSWLDPLDLGQDAPVLR